MDSFKTEKQKKKKEEKALERQGAELVCSAKYREHDFLQTSAGLLTSLRQVPPVWRQQDGVQSDLAPVNLHREFWLEKHYAEWNSSLSGVVEVKCEECS